MKILVGADLGSYTFDVATKKVTISGLEPLALEQVFLIANVTVGKIIFQFNNAALVGSISSNEITLNPLLDLTGMANTDRLAIFIEYPPASLLTKPTPRGEISGLSFVQSLAGVGSVYQSSWVRIDEYKWLDFDVEVGSSSAFSALLEFTDAADPNVTPPGGNDIVRSLTQTIGGVNLGGPANVLSFGVPAQLLWVRIKATSITGAQTVKAVTFGQVVPPPGAQIPLGASITKDFRAPLVQSMNKAHNPAGEFIPDKASGILSTQSSTATILAAGNFTGSDWIDSTGYVGVAVFLKSNANSASEGVILQKSFDNGVTIHDEETRTYDSSPDASNFKFPIITPGVKVRIKVVAGGSDMTGLILKSYLLSESTEDVSVPMDATVSAEMVGDLTHSQIVAEKSGGGWARIGATSNEHLKIAIAEHTSDTPIKSLLGPCSTLQVTVGTAAVQLDSPALGNRKTVRIKAFIGNSDDIYIGYSNAVTVNTGDQLNPGEAIDIEISDGVSVFGISASAGQKMSVNQVS